MQFNAPVRSGAHFRNNHTVKMRLLRLLLKIVRSEQGTSSIEYGLILAFIVLLMHVALQALAGETLTMWTTISSKSAAAITSH